MKKPKTMEKYKINRYKIAGGNTTSLVMGCPVPERDALSTSELRSVEQVGYVGMKNNLPALEMMGGEFCVNATLAFAKQLGNKKGQIITSGIETPVRYSNIGETTQATFLLNPEVNKARQIVLFDGIGYVCTENGGYPTESYLADLAEEFAKPAFGVARYQGNSMEPFVYVAKIKSVVAETSCGSGSIALSLITGFPKIVQRTGQPIYVMRSGNQFTVSAKVVKMRK